MIPISSSLKEAKNWERKKNTSFKQLERNHILCMHLNWENVAAKIRINFSYYEAHRSVLTRKQLIASRIKYENNVSIALIFHIILPF